MGSEHVDNDDDDDDDDDDNAVYLPPYEPSGPACPHTQQHTSSRLSRADVSIGF